MSRLRKYLPAAFLVVATIFCAGALCLRRGEIAENKRILRAEFVRDSIAQAHRPRRVRMVVAGDLMQHLPQVNAARTAEGFDYAPCFEWVRPRFAEADLAVVNLETTLTPAPPYTGYPMFRSPRALARAMREAGIDLAVMANNHCADGGRKGVDHTIAALTEEGIAHTGVFRDSTDFQRNHPLLIERNGIRFAVVNYTYGTNGLPTPAGKIINLIDTLAIKRDIAEIDRRKVDCIIAALHWGIEYQRHPNAEQRAVAQLLRRAGVDLVLGSHPHVVQPFEEDSTGIVLYSLGNFVSNQRQRYTDGGLVATIDITRHYDGRMAYALEITPVWVRHNGYRIIPPEVGDTLKMHPAERQAYETFMRDTRELLGI